MDFIKKLVPAAVKYMRQEGILASLTLSQALLESSSGKSELAVKANNLFGMKASSLWKGPTYDKKTKEFVDGKEIEVTASFCKFKSLEECIEYRSKVFLKAKRYERLWGIADYKEACQIIYECGYATDPNYPQKLIDVIEKYKLYEYDKGDEEVFKLYLDPGHGGKDPGAVGNGLQEKDVVLSICLKIREILAHEYDGVAVKMSRTSDTFPSLKQRTDEANNWGAHFFLSVHTNAGGGTGFETLRYTGTGGKTADAQSIIHDEIMKVIGIRDRGKKQQNVHVLRESRMPAALTENGFIDSANDSAKMKDSNWINAVARAHVTGLEKTFNLKRKTGTVASSSKVTSSTPYKVIIPNAAFWQARLLVNDYKKKGFADCYGVALKKYGIGEQPSDKDPYQFVIETDHETAKLLVVELKTKGYDRTYGEMM